MRYERILIEIVVFERGWVTLSANFREKGRSFANDSWRQKTRVPELLRGVCLRDPMFSRLDIIPAYDKQSDRQTHDDG